MTKAMPDIDSIACTDLSDMDETPRECAQAALEHFKNAASILECPLENLDPVEDVMIYSLEVLESALETSTTSEQSTTQEQALESARSARLPSFPELMILISPQKHEDSAA